MRYALVFTLLGGLLALYALLLGDWAWGLLWPAFGFAWVGAGYAGLGAGVFGKQADGRRRWWARVSLAPVLLMVWIVWHLARCASRLAVAHEVVPGLWVGRWPRPSEVPPGIALVVDLTAELPGSTRSRPGRDYWCLPMLDGTPPAEDALRALLDTIARSPGPVLLHCAQGQGRSALVAAAVLWSRGLARDAAEALALVRAGRPGIRLQRSQRLLLERLCRQQSTETGKASASC
jgi:protein-tyrosine phosphatase